MAVAGVCRFNSKSNDLLQLTDLIVGIINYDLKLSLGMDGAGDAHKIELVNHFKSNVGVANFIAGHRSYNFNIFVDKDVQDRQINQTNEKGLSS